ncbi:MAG TPA: NAD(P)/FAD-dependent oxidoreductase, partial [Solirubrobacteraceae bacterium]|nr:NAD(P)/FAD-dependent oxidoreductase [Solirubrobacteraceae bacterium]
NGLTAAIALAEAGRDVTVLEASGRAGGAVATEELTLPGFRHDRFSAVYPAAVASPVFARMPLDRHGLRWIHPRRCYAHPLPDGRAGALSVDMEETTATLDALHPGDGDAWRAFATPYVKHFGAWRDTMLHGFPPVRGPARMLAAHGLGGTLDFAKLLLTPAQALAGRLFSANGSRAWLYGSAMHGDAPPMSAGSAIAATHLNVLGHAVGWPSPEGGAGRLAEALVSHLESLGGTVRTGARVERIAVERGRAVGVELAGGERVAGPLIVADVTPAALLRLCGDALGGRYAAGLRAWRVGPATLKLDWALDGPIPWTAPEAREAGTVHVGGAEGAVIEALSPVGDELHPRPFMLLGQQSVADPTRAPAGKHTAWAYTHGPQDADWAGETDRQVERMEAQVERFAPGFRDLILARHVQGPADLERANPNLEGGDVGAGSYALDQVVFRPVAKLDPYRTPVRGLYLGSASTFPGGAVHGACGDAAARRALADARVRRY